MKYYNISFSKKSKGILGISGHVGVGHVTVTVVMQKRWRVVINEKNTIAFNRRNYSIGFGRRWIGPEVNRGTDDKIYS